MESLSGLVSHSHAIVVGVCGESLVFDHQLGCALPTPCCALSEAPRVGRQAPQKTERARLLHHTLNFVKAAHDI